MSTISRFINYLYCWIYRNDVYCVKNWIKSFGNQIGLLFHLETERYPVDTERKLNVHKTSWTICFFMQMEKALINDRLRVSWKFCIPNIYNFAIIYPCNSSMFVIRVKAILYLLFHYLNDCIFKMTRFYLFSFVITPCHSVSLVVYLVITGCIFCTTRSYWLSFVITRCVTCCHSKYHSSVFFCKRSCVT